MIPIIKEQLQSLTDRLDDPNQLDACKDEMRRIRDKQWESFRSSEGSCCLVPSPDADLFSEVHMMDRVVTALEQRDAAEAASLLREALSSADT